MISSAMTSILPRYSRIPCPSDEGGGTLLPGRARVNAKSWMSVTRVAFETLASPTGAPLEGIAFLPRLVYPEQAIATVVRPSPGGDGAGGAPAGARSV